MITALLVTLILQTLATMAAFSLAAVAPAVAADLNIDGNLIGFFVSVVYGVGVLSAVGSVTFIHRHGPARVGQFTMLTVVAMLVISGAGTAFMDGLLALALAALVMGCGYGATAPISTAVLVPRTPVAQRNFIFSIRQIGVPLGGVLAALVVPVVATAAGWRLSLLFQIVPVALVVLVLAAMRRDWDAPAADGTAVSAGGGPWWMRARARWRVMVAPLANGAIARLSAACFCYTGIQLSFVAFLVVQLTGPGGLDLVVAARFLALYQIAGVVSRPIWGWFADRVIGARWLLAMQGVIMAGAAVAAAHLGADWSLAAITAICVAAGISASGYTGIAYGEYARLGGAQGTEATALGSAAMFSGVLVLPALFSVLATGLASYQAPYYGLAVLALASAWLLTRGGR